MTEAIPRPGAVGSTLGPSVPVVSVLLPAYNVESHIEEAIQSIQGQTIRDIEIVVVDDGSTDGTLARVQRLAAADSRIRLLMMERNSGIVKALNYGLTACRAPYIARMDGDDLALPERLEKQLAFLQGNPEIALVGSATSAMDAYGRSCGSSRVPATEKAILRSLRFAPSCTHTWMARRTLYELLDGYRDLPGAEDYDFLLRAVTSGFKLANLPESLMKIRIRGGNTVSVAGLKQRKTHRYVVRLYLERIRNGKDSYTPAGYMEAIRAGALATAVHRYAIGITQSAFSRPGMVRRFALCGLAALISPWQARYFIDRLRWRLCIRSS